MNPLASVSGITIDANGQIIIAGDTGFKGYLRIAPKDSFPIYRRCSFSSWHAGTKYISNFFYRCRWTFKRYRLHKSSSTEFYSINLNKHYLIGSDIDFGVAGNSTISGTFNGGLYGDYNSESDVYANLLNLKNPLFTINNGNIECLNIECDVAEYEGTFGSVTIENRGMISNITISGDIVSSNNVGGIAYTNFGNIKNSFINCSISANITGGVAYSNNGLIEGTIVNSDISANALGGISYINNIQGVISDSAVWFIRANQFSCLNDTGKLGVVVAENYGDITLCYANSYNTGTNPLSTLTNYSAGFVAFNDGDIEECFSNISSNTSVYGFVYETLVISLTASARQNFAYYNTSTISQLLFKI
jgi:hypothetical protein